MKNIFKLYPKLESYYTTSDGNNFFKKDAAKNHAKSLKDKSIKEVKKKFADADADDEKAKKLAEAKAKADAEKAKKLEEDKAKADAEKAKKLEEDKSKTDAKKVEKKPENKTK